MCKCPVRMCSPLRRRLPVPMGILATSSFCILLWESNSKPQSGSGVASSRAIRSPTQVVAASGPGRLPRAGADAQELMRGSPSFQSLREAAARKVSGTLVGRHACDRKSPQRHQLRGRKWLENPSVNSPRCNSDRKVLRLHSSGAGKWSEGPGFHSGRAGLWPEEPHGSSPREPCCG